MHRNRRVEPSIVKAEELVASGGTDLRCRQLQLLRRLGDGVKAGEKERLCGGRRPHQLFPHRDDEVQVPEAHMRARDPAEVVTSHPMSGVDIETRKRPLPSAPTVSVSSYH